MSLAKLLLTTAAISSIALSASAQDKALIGTWEGWLVNGDGSQTAQRQSRIGEMVITAAQITSRDGRGTSMGAGTYKVGAAGAVKTIDATAKSKSWQETIKRMDWTDIYLAGDDFNRYVDDENKRIGDILAKLHLKK